jgi:hypothetical protein
MHKPVYIEHQGFHGTGTTAKEAKLDAIRKIEALHEGYWQPTLREWRGHAVLIHRDLEGWQYTFLQHNYGQLKMHGTTIDNGDYRETLRSAERHLADIGWTVADPLDLFPAWFSNAEDRREILSRRTWQLRVRHHLDAGHDLEAARRLADDPATAATSL